MLVFKLYIIQKVKSQFILFILGIASFKNIFEIYKFRRRIEQQSRKERDIVLQHNFIIICPFLLLIEFDIFALIF